MRPITVFCLPFAGGNKYSYRDYEAHCPPHLRLVPIEYPGRGARMREPLLHSMDAIVGDLYAQVKKSVDNEPYILYGHSMGGLAVCLLAQKLVQYRHRAPLQLFITGTMGPSAWSRTDKARHLMGKKEFIQEIIDLDGMPGEILRNAEMMDYFEPILRADFTATDTYVYKPEPPLRIPMTVITGDEEDMTDEDIGLWQQETVQPVDFRKLPGKHFFIFRFPGEVMNVLATQSLNHIKIYQS